MRRHAASLRVGHRQSDTSGSVRFRRYLVGGFGAVLLALGNASDAAGATDVVPIECIAPPNDSPGCGATQLGLGAARGTAISPDGKSLYQLGSDAIVHFGRDTDSGALTGRGCIADVGDPVGCGATEQGLDDSFQLAVSPDGRSVYVVGENDNAIVHFDRDTTTGELTGRGCISDPVDPPVDPPPPPEICETTTQGLEKPRDVAVSPDGNSVYVVSAFDDSIVRFDRNSATGELTARGCIEDVDPFPYDSFPPGCGTTQQGLEEANGVEVSPDGSSVYVTGEFDNAIVHFDRDTTTGELTGRGCISDVGDEGDCGVTQQGLSAPYGLAISPDGASVYVTAVTDNAIVHFDRDTTTGELTGRGCISDIGDSAGCGDTQAGLSRARRVAVSPDGKSVYATASDALVHFDRNSTNGVLTGRGCVGGGGCEASQRGLNGAHGIAVSPDSKAVYVSGTALVRFAVSSAPDTKITSGPKWSTNDTTPRFEFSYEQSASTVECRFDSEPFGACSGPGDSHSPSTPLAHGDHVFEVRAVGPSGEADPTPATRSFRVDTVPPYLRITNGPRGPTANPRPKFSFSLGWAATAKCSIDTGAASFGPCSGDETHRPDSPLDDGTYTFRVRATDPAGNQTTKTRNFSVDTQVPETSIDRGPESLTNDPAPSFEFSSNEPDVTFECMIDFGAWFDCESPQATFALADGPHRFRVRATDQAGQTDSSPATREFSVDTRAPTVSISCPPAPDPTTISPVECTASWNDPGARASGVPYGGVVYGLDDDPSGGINYVGHFYSGPFEVSGIGRWRVLALAVDRAGNVSLPDTVEVRIDASLAAFAGA